MKRHSKTSGRPGNKGRDPSWAPSFLLLQGGKYPPKAGCAASVVLVPHGVRKHGWADLGPALTQRGGSTSVKRIKVILATVAAVALMLLAASPALASHGWEGTAWEQ